MPIKILFLKKSWFFSVDADSSRQSHAGGAHPNPLYEWFSEAGEVN
jgi:hypothetical protein